MDEKFIWVFLAALVVIGSILLFGLVDGLLVILFFTAFCFVVIFAIGLLAQF